MTDVHVKIQVTTADFGEDFVVTKCIDKTSRTIDLFHYEFDRDDEMTCFDTMLADFEVIVGEYIGEPVKLRWMNTEDEDVQYFFFRIPLVPFGMDYNSVLVEVHNKNDGAECVMEFYTFDSIAPELRAPGQYRYKNKGHFTESVVANDF